MTNGDALVRSLTLILLVLACMCTTGSFVRPGWGSSERYHEELDCLLFIYDTRYRKTQPADSAALAADMRDVFWSNDLKYFAVRVGEMTKGSGLVTYNGTTLIPTYVAGRIFLHTPTGHQMYPRRVSAESQTIPGSLK